MSHFTVIVIGENIDEQLAPYAEQDFEDQYGVFEDTEDSNMKEYLEESVEIIQLSNGTLHNKYEDIFRYYDNKSMESKYRYPEDATIRQGKYTELYSTFEEFMEQWHGYQTRDEVKNRYGYWSNPNAKWDWYTVGGRWSGFFKLKEGAIGELGSPGVFDNTPKAGYVDSCLIKDIDFTAMQHDALIEANQFYDQLESVLKGRELPSWNIIREKHGEDITAAREEYNSLEVVKDLNKANIWAWGDLKESFGPNRQAYCDRQVAAVMVPFAVVKNGQWYEKGKMGWWAITHNEMKQEDWNKEFWKLLKNLPEDTRLTLVDCHI